MNSNENGRSIVEVLGVLAIMGVITVLGISGYTAALEKNRKDKFEIQLHEISSKVAEIYAGKIFPPLTTYIYFTNELEKMGFELIDPWGNEIRVRYPVSGVDSADQFVIATRLEKSRCEWAIAKFEEKRNKGDVCATLWPALTSIDICDNRGCVEAENLVTFRYRIM